MEHLKEVWKAMWFHAKLFLRWIITGLAIGCVVGLFGTFFAWAMRVVMELRAAYPQLLFGLPVAGIIIAWLYGKSDQANNLNTNLVFYSIRSTEEVPFRMAPLIFVGTLLTHLCGGSSGREGAALQMGGSVAQEIGRLLKVDERTIRIFTMCGMSACFAALFGTPVAATVFSLEVVSVGIMHYSALIPCAMAALTADVIARNLGVEHMQFFLMELGNHFSMVTGMKVCLLAVGCAIVSMCFCILLHFTGKCYERLFKNQMVRAFVGGLLVVLLAVLLHTSDYLSVGETVLRSAVYGNARPEAFLLKMIFTALTLEAGFKGGEIVPTLFIGSTFGCVAGKALGLSGSFGGALGMTALFCGVTNCPVTSILLGMELFGGKGIEWFLIVAAISYMLSGYYSLYSKQKIVYSKETPKYIDTTCH